MATVQSELDQLNAIPLLIVQTQLFFESPLMHNIVYVQLPYILGIRHAAKYLARFQGSGAGLEELIENDRWQMDLSPSYEGWSNNYQSVVKSSNVVASELSEAVTLPDYAGDLQDVRPYIVPLLNDVLGWMVSVPGMRAGSALSSVQVSSYLLGFSDYLAHRGEVNSADDVRGFTYHLAERLVLAEIERQHQLDGKLRGVHAVDFGGIVDTLVALEKPSAMSRESPALTSFKQKLAEGTMSRLGRLPYMLRGYSDRSLPEPGNL